MTSLFPQFNEGFVAKADSGMLVRYCARCNQHLDAHGTTWRTAEGSVRTCPAVPPSEPTFVQQTPVVASQSTADDAATKRYADPPFGTDFTTDAAGKNKVGKRILPTPGHPGEEQSDLVRSTRCRPYEPGNLRGAGVDASESVIATDARKPVPCRRSNTSTFVGAAVLPPS